MAVLTYNGKLIGLRIQSNASASHRLSDAKSLII